MASGDAIVGTPLEAGEARRAVRIAVAVPGFLAKEKKNREESENKYYRMYGEQIGRL